MNTVTSVSGDMTNSGRVSVREVAARAGVSIATVSRVVNSPESVRPATLERVHSAMRELGYVPHGAARSLANGRAGSLGVAQFSPHAGASDVFFMEILRGIESAVAASGLAVVTFVQMVGDPRPTRLIQLIASGRLDGVIVAGGPLPQRARTAARRARVPVLLLGPHESDPGDWIVMVDSRQGSADAVRHLIEQGRRRIVHIGGPLENAVARMKFEGYSAALSQAGLPVDPRLHVQSAVHSRDSGQRAIELLLERGIEFDAVYAADDLLALGAVRALSQAGRRIPDDVAVAGYGDLDEAQFANPPLTSVHVDFHQQGWLAGTIMVQTVTGSAPPSVRIKIETTLIPRASTISR